MTKTIVKTMSMREYRIKVEDAIKFIEDGSPVRKTEKYIGNVCLRLNKAGAATKVMVSEMHRDEKHGYLREWIFVDVFFVKHGTDKEQVEFIVENWGLNEVQL